MSCVRVAAIATLAACATAAPAADKVTSLPGYGAPPTDTWSGEFASLTTYRRAARVCIRARRRQHPLRSPTPRSPLRVRASTPLTLCAPPPTGYVDIPGGKHIHYYFAASQGNPATDPVVLCEKRATAALLAALS